MDHHIAPSSLHIYSFVFFSFIFFIFLTFLSFGSAAPPSESFVSIPRLLALLGCVIRLSLLHRITAGFVSF